MKQLLTIIACCLGILVSQPLLAKVVYVHNDVLGSPVMRTDANGNVISRAHYKPFGETLEAAKDDVGYTGHLNDTDLGLSYMQARYYDPVIGRFYSNDPVGFRDVHSFNRYAYANNNPYKYTDPDGQMVIPLPPPPPIVLPVTPPAGSLPFLPPSVPSGGTPPITLPDIIVPSIASVIFHISVKITDIIQKKDDSGNEKKKNRIKQGREQTEKKRSNKKFKNNPNKNQNKKPKKHTPSKRHTKTTKKKRNQQKNK